MNRAANMLGAALDFFVLGLAILVCITTILVWGLPYTLVVLLLGGWDRNRD